MTFSTSPGFVLAEQQQFLTGDGVRFNFCPTRGCEEWSRNYFMALFLQN